MEGDWMLKKGDSIGVAFLFYKIFYIFLCVYYKICYICKCNSNTKLKIMTGDISKSTLIEEFTRNCEKSKSMTGKQKEKMQIKCMTIYRFLVGCGIDIDVLSGIMENNEM